MGYETWVPVLHMCSVSWGMGARGIRGERIKDRHMLYIDFLYTYDFFVFFTETEHTQRAPMFHIPNFQIYF